MNCIEKPLVTLDPSVISETISETWLRAYLMAGFPLLVEA